MKRFVLFLTMSIAFIALANGVFAVSENINFAVASNKTSQRIENSSILKQRDVEKDLKLKNQDISSTSVGSNEIDDYYGVKAFLVELQKLKPNLELSSKNQYISTYREIFNMYRDMNPELSNETIAERAKANMLNKIEFEIGDSGYKAEHITDCSAKEPDGYEIIVNYINENLKPDYHATLVTTKENIDILKKNMNNLPDNFKDMALLYIEDMESGSKLDEIKVHKNLKTNTLSRSSENDTTLKSVSSIGSIIISIVLIGASIFLILFLKIFIRARKK